MSLNEENQSVKLSRRKFVGTIGKSAVAFGLPSILGIHAARAQELRPRRFVLAEDRFGRIFPRLAPFAEPSRQLQAALMEIGKPGGLLDAKDALDQGPVELIVNLDLSKNNPNNTTHTAGTTFMGQFMDHDMTFDLTSRLGRATDPERSPNVRTPALDLDAVYGGGPIADRELYEQVRRAGKADRGIKFKVESGGRFEDLPRKTDGSAIIADPRNDENLMIAGLHTAFLMFHNKVVDLLANSFVKLAAAGNRLNAPEDLFRRARQLITWHYQWMIVHEFLPLFIGETMVDDILARGRKFYRPDVAFIPVEFQGAAYRFGHSMVRPSYRANLKGDADNQPFFG